MARIGPTFASFLVLLAWLACLPNAARADTGAHFRIFRVEPLDGGGVRLFATLLDQGLAPVAIEDLVALEVERAATRQNRQTLEVFKGGAPTKTKGSQLAPLGASDALLDMVIVVSGNQDPDRGDILDGLVREAAQLLLKQAPKSAWLNLIWITDTVRTYVANPNKAGELSDTWEAAGFCRRHDAAYYEDLVSQGPLQAAHPCGLHPDRGGILAAMKQQTASTAFDGFYPALLGLPRKIGCVGKPSQPHALDDLLTSDSMAESVARRQRTGALDEAVRLLTSYGRAGSTRVILYLGDGKDWYVLAAEECRPKALEICRKRGETGKRDLSRCARRWIERNLFGPEQRLFVKKARRLLPMMRAAGIRLDAVLLPTARPHEAERMRLLSLKSGGTFRMARSEEDLLPLAEMAAAELSGSYVVDARPPKEMTFPEGEEVGIQLSAVVETDDGDERIRTQRVVTQMPVPDRSLVGKYNSLRSWLAARVGKKAAKYIMLAVTLLLALLLATIFFKLFKKLFKGIGRVAKKARR